MVVAVVVAVASPGVVFNVLRGQPRDETAPKRKCTDHHAVVAVVGAGGDGVHDGLHGFEMLGRGEIKGQQMCPDVREQRRDGFRHDVVMARRGTDAGGHGGAQPVQFGHDLLQQFRGRKGLNGQTGDGIDFRDFFLGP